MYPMYWAHSYVGGISKVKEAETVDRNDWKSRRRISWGMVLEDNVGRGFMKGMVNKAGF